MKRFLDIILSLILITALSPLLVIVAILVKITSKGPIFFVQERLTIGQKRFKILKFRTMFSNFDKERVGIQIKASSTGVTKLGSFLRKTKIDELPQLFNILMGDMSFVGPRPELPRRLKYYNEELMQVFTVKSGISSPASILFSDEEFLMEHVDDAESFYVSKILPLKARMNLDYATSKNFAKDIKVFLLTIFKLLNINSHYYDKLFTDKSLLEQKRNLIETSQNQIV